MDTQSPPTLPRITTLWGGCGIVVSAVLTVLAALNVAVPLAVDYSFPLASVVPRMLSSIILLVAMGILAFGIRGESGIVGPSVLGKVALLVFGAGSLVSELLSLIPLGFTPGVFSLQLYSGLAWEVIGIVAAVIAAVVVVRAGILHGIARWMLLVVAVWSAIMIGQSFIPFLALAYYLAAWQVGLARPVLLLVLGAAYLLHGQSAAIRHRAQVINEKW